jgi:hypothetical protein
MTEMTTTKTSDLQFASFLISKGYELSHLEGERGRRYFVFKTGFDPKLFQGFHVSPEKRLLDANRYLKTMLQQASSS